MMQETQTQQAVNEKVPTIEEEILAEARDLKIKVGTILDNQGKIITTQERIERQIDVVDSDRGIITNIDGKTTEIKENTKSGTETIRGQIRNAIIEIQVANDKTVAAVRAEISTLRDLIDKKKVIETPPKTWLQKLLRR